MENTEGTEDTHESIGHLKLLNITAEAAEIAEETREVVRKHYLPLRSPRTLRLIRVPILSLVMEGGNACSGDSGGRVPLPLGLILSSTTLKIVIDPPLGARYMV